MRDPALTEIDGIVFTLQRHGGISVYFRELIRRLGRDRRSALLSLASPNHFGDPARAEGVAVRERPARLLERYRPFEPHPDAAVAHSTYFRVPDTRRVPLVTTVYDFTYERYWRGPALWVHRAQKRRAILRSEAVICISHSTRDDLLRLVPGVDPQRVTVVHLGVGEAFGPVDVDPPARPFVLFVGKRESYKNFKLVVDAVDGLKGLDVLCVGGERPGDRDYRDLPEHARGRVKLLGVVDDASLNRLYNQATCLAYTSEYEGFGIPVLEAMRAGCPVVTSGCAAVMEVARGACRVVPPGDPGALALACLDMGRPAVREEVRQAGFAAAKRFSWDACYRETLAVYDDVERAAARSRSA
jgi:mannosyltransferase